MMIDQEIIDFKQHLIANNLTGLALDIDDTLSQTKKSLLNCFYRTIGNPENLTPDEFCQKYHLIQDAPYFQTPQGLDLINKLARSPETFCDLEIIDNSNFYVNEINKTIPIIAYITMRPQLTINVTQTWLDRYNFPKAKLISCPDSLACHSIEWKTSVLEALYPQVIGIVDDSLGVAKNISSDYKGKIYLYNIEPYSSRPEINIIPCPTWGSVLDKIHS